MMTTPSNAVSPLRQRLRRVGLWLSAHPALGLLHAAVFCMPFSLPMGRILLAGALGALGVQVLRGKVRFRMPASAWLWVAWVGLAAVVTAFGVDPAVGCRKLDKLIWFMGIPVAAGAVRNHRDAIRVLRSLALGCLALAVWLCLRNPAMGLWQVRQGLQPDLETALIDLGALDDGQRLMVGVVVALGLWLSELKLRRRGGMLFWGVGLLIIALAEGLALKRGSWLVTALVAGGMVAVAWGWWRACLLGVVAAALLCSFAPARDRLRDLPSELLSKRGGRMTMWTRIAPALHRDYPWGVGFRSLSNDLMRQYAPEVERNRDHLHSNPVQVFVALGWAGLLLYLLWMGWALRDAVRFGREDLRAEGPPGLAAPARWLPFCLLLALILNGLVEYNLADGEIVLLYGVVIGLAAVRTRSERPHPA